MTSNERLTLVGTGLVLVYLAWKNRAALPDILTPAVIAAAIGQIESGGNYGAIGPLTNDGHRAYGKYQVLDSNIGPWSRLALGAALTPDQFLADPASQDIVAQWKIDQLFTKWQNAGDVAAVWFSGRPLAEAMNRADVTGTTVQQYVDRVLAVL